MSRLYLFSLLLILLALGACNSGASSQKKVAQDSEITVPVKEVVMEGLKRPWSMAFLSEDEALVAEKDGDLLMINLETKSRKVIDGFPDDLADSLLINVAKHPAGTHPKRADGLKKKYNTGIFDIVLDPNFDNNRWIYISYVSERDKQFATKVIRAKLENNKLEDIQTLLLALPYADGLFHFGGGLVFGADDKLYITIGERLYGDALQPNLPIAQDIEDMRGKIYRINADGSIPDDNPRIAGGAISGIYATGIRAAQGLTIDPRTDKIWFSEHGTYQGDELNQLIAGANYGWPIKSTGDYRGGYVPPKLDRDFTDPKWSWYKTIAPTGLTFYTGTEFPQWKNNLIIPGLSRGNFWRLVIEGDQVQSVEELFITDRHRTRKAVQSPMGQLYILTDDVNGKIIRIKNGNG